jgi:hypothetical protein
MCRKLFWSMVFLWLKVEGSALSAIKKSSEPRL